MNIDLIPEVFLPAAVEIDWDRLPDSEQKKLNRVITAADVTLCAAYSTFAFKDRPDECKISGGGKSYIKNTILRGYGNLIIQEGN